jgi:cysteine synthase A
MIDLSLIKKYPTLLTYSERMGNTKMVRIPTPVGDASIFAKYEATNPFGSIKDRTAFGLIYNFIKENPGIDLAKVHLLEYSGGNLAKSLANICHELNISLTLVLSSFVSTEFVQSLELLGATVVIVPKELGFIATIEKTIELNKSGKYHFLYQHKNNANLWVHQNMTSVEILDDMGDLTIDGWTAAIGTGGTLVGVAQTLLQKNPMLKIWGVTPSELPYGSMLPPNGLPKFAGSGGFGAGIKQPFVEAFESSIEKQKIFALKECYPEMLRTLEEVGMRIGTSAAANLLSAREMARVLGKGKNVVTVLPDAGSQNDWTQAQAYKTLGELVC